MMFQRDDNGLRFVDRFDVLLLDNASIHHTHASFIRELERYMKVMFIPPYCYHLSPLDYGVQSARLESGRSPHRSLSASLARPKHLTSGSARARLCSLA